MKKQLVTICFLFILLTSCDPVDDRLVIVNKTGFPIYYDFFFDMNDTSHNVLGVYISNEIKINDSSSQSILGTDAWLRQLQQSDTKSLSLYFYNTDSIRINQYKYKNMRQYFLANRYFKEMQLNEKQLDSSNWVITVNE